MFSNIYGKVLFYNREDEASAGYLFLSWFGKWSHAISVPNIARFEQTLGKGSNTRKGNSWGVGNRIGRKAPKVPSTRH